jgi:hypothetical protein
MRTIFNHLQRSNPNNTQITMTTTPSTRLYDQACIAAEKANTLRYNAARLSVPDELHWYNNHTNWDALSRKEFRDIMIRMESVTVQFYNDYEDCTYPSRHVAIKAFWANEWGCEYLSDSGKWRDCDSGSVIRSETEKKAKRDAKKALKKGEKLKQQQLDEEDEAYADAYAQARAEKDQALEQARAEEQAQKAQKAQEQSKKQQQLDAEFDEEEDAWADAYAQAALARAEKEQATQQQHQQKEAQAYLDSFNYTSEEEQEEQKEPVTTRICCQAVLYIEELTEIKGDPDWRAYIYYDERIRRYVLKGTRRSLRATSKKTVFPEIKLCFRSSRELARYLCSSTDSLLNVSMFAMASATVRDATFAELYALPARGCKTELFGYDETRPRYSTFVNYLCMVRDVDATHSTFASF